MKNVVNNELMKELNFIERILVIMFYKTFNKVYKISRNNIINEFLTNRKAIRFIILK